MKSQRALIPYFMGWSSAALICLLLMLLHQSDGGSFFGRYSASYMVQLGIMSVILLVSIGMAGRAARGRLPDIRAYLPQGWRLWVLCGLGIIGLCTLWLFLPGARYLPAIALFTAYIAVLGAALVLWLARTRASEVSLHTGRALMIAALVIAVLMMGAYIGKIPPSLMFDEAWLANLGYTTATTGKAHVSMYPALSPLRVMRHPYPYILMGVWLQYTPMTLEMARLFWLFVGAASLPFLYLTARRIYGETAGILSVIIGAFFLLPHNYIRADVTTALALSAALYCWVMAHEKHHPIWYAAAGVCVAMTMSGHFLSVRWIIAFGVLMTWDYVRVLWQARRLKFYAPFWAFVAGGVIASLLFVWIQTEPWGISMLTFPQMLSDGYTHEAQLGAGAGDGLTKILNIGQEWLLQYLGIHTLEAGIAVCGILFWLWRRQFYDRHFAFLAIFGTALMIMLLPKHNIYYWIHHLPLVALGGGAVIAKLTEKPQLRFNTAGVIAILLTTGLLATNLVWRAATNTQNADGAIALSYELDRVLPPEIQRISAWQSYYFGLSDRDFVNIETFQYYPGNQWLEKMGVEPPQAIMLTIGLDEWNQVIYDYIEEAGLVLSRCFPLDIYGKVTHLYLPPEYVLPDTPGC